MAGAETNPGIVDNIAKYSKRFDMIQIAGGFIIGGPLGIALITSGVGTYYIAHRVQQRQMRK